MYLDLNVMWNPDEKYFATMNLTVPMKVIWAVDDSLPDAGRATYPLFILCLRALFLFLFLFV